MSVSIATPRRNQSKSKRKRPTDAALNKRMEASLREFAKETLASNGDKEVAEYYVTVANNLASCRGWHSGEKGRYPCGDIWLCALCARDKAKKRARTLRRKIRSLFSRSDNYKASSIMLSVPKSRSLWQPLLVILILEPISNFLAENTAGACWSLDIGREYGWWFVHIHAVVVMPKEQSAHALKSLWRAKAEAVYVVAEQKIHDPKEFKRRQNAKSLDCYAETENPSPDEIGLDAARAQDYVGHGPEDEDDDPLEPRDRWQIFKAFLKVIERAQRYGNLMSGNRPRTQGFTGVLEGHDKIWKAIETASYTESLSLVSDSPLKSRIAKARFQKASKKTKKS